MAASQLLTETRAMLDKRDISLREISEHTRINLHWLRKFQQGKFEDPGVNKVERLHTFLTNSEAQDAHAT